MEQNETYTKISFFLFLLSLSLRGDEHSTWKIIQKKSGWIFIFEVNKDVQNVNIKHIVCRLV